MTSRHRLGRRAFLGVGALGAVGCATWRSAGIPPLRDARVVTVGRVDPAVTHGAGLLHTLRETETGFPLGVLAGDATDRSAIVWTQFTGEGVPVLWIERAPTGAGEPPAFAAPVEPDENGYVHLDVQGLAPGSLYRYAFGVMHEGRVVRGGPTGVVRTAPAEDASPIVTFAGTSCTNQFVRPFPAMQHAAERGDLDFFLHAGDHVYCDFVTNQRDYRDRYATGWSAPGMRALHASVGHYVTWDDHEVANNWDPETHDPAKVAIARRTFFEHNPVRRHPEAPERIWRSVRWGRTLELFILDSRGERRPSTRRTPGATYLSRAQMDWLKTGLAESPAHFKIILNSVPITNFPGVFDQLDSDRWEGYPAQRREILSWITSQHVGGVWWLSGDFHFGTVAHVEPEGPYATQREVLMGPGKQLANILAGMLGGPQFEFITQENNYAVFRADPTRDVMEVSFVGETGATLFHRAYAPT